MGDRRYQRKPGSSLNIAHRPSPIAHRPSPIAHRFREEPVKIAVQIEPANGKGAGEGTNGATTPTVEYTWDPDTDILSAQLSPRSAGEGMSGSVGLEGSDGSWLILDVAAGRITGVEVAVWPDVRKLATLEPPATVEDARVVVPARRSQPDIASLEMDTRLTADADRDQRTFHFRVGKPRGSRTIRLARDLLLDVDEKSHISGLWLLNVPPGPAEL
jgi:hypothetical protein